MGVVMCLMANVQSVGLFIAQAFGRLGDSVMFKQLLFVSCTGFWKIRSFSEEIVKGCFRRGTWNFTFSETF